MTAVLGVLNKHAVAIAADSAVTHLRPNGQKISNTANKIYKLSTSYPVGVAIYNSSEYMGTPWDIVISTYRKKSRDKHFDFLNGYVRDFLDYVRAEFSPSTNEEREFLGHLMMDVWKSIEEDAEQENGGSIVESSIDSFVSIVRKLFDTMLNTLSKIPIHKEFSNYTLEEFRTTYHDLFDAFYSEIIVKQRALLLSKISADEWFDIFTRVIFAVLVSQNTALPSSGLVFVGYGEKEYFPALITIQIYSSLSNRLRYVVVNEKHISKDDEAAIFPYAQHDVIDTILSGVDPSLEEAYVDNCIKIVRQMREKIIEEINKTDQEIAKQLSNIDPESFRTTLLELNKSVKKRYYIDPLLSTICAFSQEELANMAERMIDLTSLKRKMTPDDESVGGPVDVAVISKSDGFVWIKRKQYFDKELNIDYIINKIHDDTKSI